ncbi:restriction endonuclease subunit S [Staphylococcus pseudintermedius]|nr:restriction endonuclease subunit S [Staphylococcus pseudintermedius]
MWKILTRKLKETNIDWIGEVPKNWKISTIGSHYTERTDKVSDLDYIPLSVTKSGIVPQLEIAAKSSNHDNRKLVLKDDFVINSRSDRKMSAGISSINGSVSVINTVLYSNTIDRNYTKYLLKNYAFAEEFYKWGTGIVDDLWSTKWLKMKNIPIPVPPREKQKQIGAVIDSMVQNTNNIIDGTKESISELKKYRQSMITEVVTKGLNPNVKMKESGIDWIGQVPEHWVVTRPNRVTTITRGNSEFQKIDMKNTGDYIAVQYGQVYKLNVLDEKYQLYVDEKFYKEEQIVQKGDTILVSTSETIEDLGHSCFYNRKDLGLLGGEQLCLKPNNQVLFDKFLYYATTYFNLELNQYATGLKVYRFKLDDLKKINMILPPTLGEQKQIVEYLDDKVSTIDKLIKDKTKVIEELEIYKKSLIYEYVTGKKEV